MNTATIINKQQEIINAQKSIIDKSKEIIKITEEELTHYKDNCKQLLDDFNNLPTCEDLYQHDVKEKINNNKKRYDNYLTYINREGTQNFVDLFISAHKETDYV